MPLRKTFSQYTVYFCQRSWKSGGSTFLRHTWNDCRTESDEWNGKPEARWCVCSSLKSPWRKWVGWDLVVEGGGLHHKSGVPPRSGTCKSGERRMGTQPNDSSTVLYKYCCTGSARLLLLVAKKPRDTGVSPSERKVFNNPLIFFSPSQTCRWITHYLLPLSGREAGRKGI